MVQLCKPNNECQRGQNGDGDLTGASSLHILLNRTSISLNSSYSAFQSQNRQVLGLTGWLKFVVKRSCSSSESSLATRGSTVGGLLCRGPRPPILDEPAGEDMISLCTRLSFIRVLEFWELVCCAFRACVAGRGSMATPSAKSCWKTRKSTEGGGGRGRRAVNLNGGAIQTRRVFESVCSTVSPPRPAHVLSNDGIYQYPNSPCLYRGTARYVPSVYAVHFIPDFCDFIQPHIRLMSVCHILISRELRDAQISPDLSRLKAMGRPEGELPFDVRAFCSVLKTTG